MSLYCFDEKDIHENTVYKLSAIFKLTWDFPKIHFFPVETLHMQKQGLTKC